MTISPVARRRLACSGVLLVVASGCGDSDGDVPGAEIQPTPVRTVPMTVSREAEPVRTSGTVAARTEMGLAFKVPGYVAEILVAEGERVVLGQTLARLQTAEVDAQARAAEAQADLAARNLRRIESLFADSVVTEATMDEARDAHERAQAAVDIAAFNRDNATIRAPGAGRVLRRLAELAEFVGAGTPVLRFGASGGGWVVHLSVTDRQVVRLSVGDPAEIRLSALGEDPLRGTVREITDASDPRTGGYGVEVGIAGDPARVRSGLVATVSIQPADEEELSYLPPQALIDTEGLDAAVFVVDGDRVRRRPVRVVRIGIETVGVRAPDLEGEMVVTDGAAYLRDGDRIEDRTTEVPPARR